MFDLAAEVRIRTELCRVHFAIVRIVDVGGERRDLAVPETKKRWETVSKLMGALPWTRAELLNKEGQLVGLLENDASPSVVEDLTSREGRDMAQLERMCRLMAGVSDQAVARYAQLLGPSLHAMTSTIQLLATRLDRMEREREERGESQVEIVEVPSPEVPQLSSSPIIDELVKQAGPALVANLVGGFFGRKPGN